MHLLLQNVYINISFVQSVTDLYSVTVLYSLSQFFTVCHRLLQSITVLYSLSQFCVVYHKFPSYKVHKTFQLTR